MIVRPAQAADVDGMVELLHTQMNPKFSRQRWRRLFEYDWCPDKPDFGRVAILDGEIVGCIAAVYSDRWIAGKRERFVNPAAWYLRKEARRLKSSLGAGVGLSLIADLTSNDEWHYHINTSSKNTTALLRRIGFTVLDDAKYVWRQRRDTGSPLTFKIISGAHQLPAKLADAERRIVADHANLGVTPMLFEDVGRECLVMFAETIKGKDELWFDVLYVSDPDFLGRHGRAMADAILTVPNSFMAADCRFCCGMPENAERVKLDVPRYAKSRGLAGHHLDHLYSEIQLLDQKLR